MRFGTKEMRSTVQWLDTRRLMPGGLVGEWQGMDRETLGFWLGSGWALSGF